MAGLGGIRLAERGRRLRRRLGDAGVAAALVGLAGLLALASLVWPGQLLPASALSVPVLFGGLTLRLREMRLLLLGTVLLVVLVVSARGGHVLSAGSVGISTHRPLTSNFQPW